MPNNFTGGCICGAIRYECTAEPVFTFCCHCRDCQRSSGGAYSPVLYLPPGAFRLTRGELKHYGTPSTMGGHNLRGFCAECGARISGGEGEHGIGVTASSLDDPSWFTPQVHIFAGDAQPWDLLDPKQPHFAEYAPAN